MILTLTAWNDCQFHNIIHRVGNVHMEMSKTGGSAHGASRHLQYEPGSTACLAAIPTVHRREGPKQGNMQIRPANKLHGRCRSQKPRTAGPQQGRGGHPTLFKINTIVEIGGCTVYWAPRRPPEGTENTLL